MREAITFEFKSSLERLVRLRQAMSPAVRGRIVPVATRRMFSLIQRHFAAYAQSHHATADRLGAPHTKHMERAARNMTHETAREGDMDVGRVILRMAGVGRAFHDVTIRMKDRRLTLPISREAYGLTAREAGRKFGERNMFVFRSKRGSLILAAKRDAGGKRSRGRDGAATRTVIPLYALRERVFQRRDPSMLPPKREISEAAKAAVVECIERYVKGGTEP